MQPYTGGRRILEHDYYDDEEEIDLATIFKFDLTSRSWTEMGNMTRARNFHGASVVKAEDVQQFCV